VPVPGPAPDAEALGKILEAAATLDRKHYRPRNRLRKQFELTREGERLVADALSGHVDDWTAVDIEKALAALQVSRRRHYIVDNGEVVILGKFSKRPQPGHRWAFHHFVEAKEGVPVRPEQRTVASTDAREFYGLYERRSGTTGTARYAARVFEKHYGMRVVEVPRSKTSFLEESTHTFATESQADEFAAHVYAHGIADVRPVFVAERGIAESEAGGERHGTPFVVNGESLPHWETEVLGHAGEAGVGSVHDPGFGLGIDVRLGAGDKAQHDAINERGGAVLVVRVTNPSQASGSQLKTRVGRHGDPGFVFVVRSLGDPALDEYANPRRLRELREKYRGHSGRIVDPAVDALFEQAVRTAEQRHRVALDRVFDGEDGPDSLVHAAEPAADPHPTTARATDLDPAVAAQRGAAGAEVATAGTAAARARAALAEAWRAPWQGDATAHPVFQATVDFIRAEIAMAGALQRYRELLGATPATEDDSDRVTAPAATLTLEEVGRAYSLALDGKHDEAAAILTAAAAEAALTVHRNGGTWVGAGPTAQAAHLAAITLRRADETGADVHVVFAHLLALVAKLPGDVAVDVTARELEAELMRQLRRLTREAELTDRLGTSPGQVAATVRVGVRLLDERLGGNWSEGGDEPSALELMVTRELHVFVAWARGAAVEDIAAELGIGTTQVDEWLDMAIDWLAGPASRPVVTEADVRAQALADRSGGNGDKQWWFVRNHLRAVQSGLHPAEQVDWDGDNRVEELIAHIRNSGNGDGRHRAPAYRAFLDNGITTITQVVALDDGALAAMGLGGSATTAIRKALEREAIKEVLARHAQIDSDRREAVLPPVEGADRGTGGSPVGPAGGPPSGTTLGSLPGGRGSGADGVPPFVEGVARFGLLGRAAAAVVFAVVKLVRDVRARGPPRATEVLSRLVRALTALRVRVLGVRLGAAAAGTALAGALLGAMLGGPATAAAAAIEPGRGDAAIESVVPERGPVGAVAPEAARDDSVVVRVVPGDTIFGLTRRYGLSGYDRVTSDDPVRAAEIEANPDLIFAGEQLRILLPPAQGPGPGTEEAPLPPRSSHVSPDGGPGPADTTPPVDEGLQPPAYVRITIDVARKVLGGAVVALAVFALWQRRLAPRVHWWARNLPVEVQVWLLWGRDAVRAALSSPARAWGALRSRVAAWPPGIQLWLLWGRDWAKAPLAWPARILSGAATFLRTLKPSGEGRLYPTGLQPLLGPVGDWVFQLLHVKLALKKEVPGSKPQTFRERVRGLWQLVKSKVWNRAATVGPQFRESLYAQVPLPRWWDELFELWLGGSGGNYGVVSVLDQADNLNFRTKMRNRVVGMFPLLRLDAVLVVARLFALRVGLVHFEVPGKKIERKVPSPAVVGFHPVRRLVNWVAGHDWSLVTWQVFSYISQVHFLIGVGPPDPYQPAWAELRFAPLKVEVVRDGKVMRTISLIAAPAKAVRAVVLASARAVGRILPAAFLRRLAAVPARFRTRRVHYELKIKRRGLTRINADLGRKQDLLGEVEKALEQLGDGVRSPGPRPRDVAFFTLTGAPVRVDDLIAARRDRLEKLRSKLIDAIRTDQQSIRAIQESLTVLWDVDGSATQGSTRSAVGSQMRMTGVLGAISEPGRSGANGDSAWAAASQARVVAVIADEQGGFGSATPASAKAVGAAKDAATKRPPSTTGAQLARAMYDSAADATTPAADALDAPSTALLGHEDAGDDEKP
jgi:hypothetical protein